MPRFVNLHHHTTFSYGDGFGTPAQHVARAVELGYTAIAATEHGNVSSHFQLEKAALKAGIKPIFGIEAYCGSVFHEDDENRLYEADDGEVLLRPARSVFKHHLTILAENVTGYQNLMRIVTQSWRDFYQYPTVSGASLAENREGLVVLSGCSGSQLACALLGGKGTPDHVNEPDMEFAEEVARSFQRLLGENYCLEVQPFWELDRSPVMNRCYEELANKLGIPLVVTGDVHYPYPADAEMQAVLHAVHRGKATVEDQLREWNYDVLLTLPASDEELHKKLRKTGLTARMASQAIDNSATIGARCNVTLPKAERLRYPVTDRDLEPWS